MLDSSLGSIARSQWTELEKRIVEGFLANLMESLEEHLGNWQPNNLEGRGRVYLIVAIPTPAKLGLLALGVPVSRLPLLPADRAPARQTSECGALETIVSASAGSANVSVAEIMAMEAGDMVLLENSSSQALTLLARGQEWKSISLKPGDEWPQSLQLNPEELAEMSKGQQSNDDESNMLSSFPVELRAEFREIRLPLSRLLALDKGEALPLADLSDTELTLTSHGKPVARGELVVVGDKLAVQISEILMKQESSSQAPEA
jgi:flagellar motor switch protein FliN/FliY